MQNLHECALWFQHSGEMPWWMWAEAKFPVFYPLLPHWQLLSDVVRHLADAYIIAAATDVDVPDIYLHGPNKRIRFHSLQSESMDGQF